MKIGIDVRCLMESQYSGISEYTYNLLTGLFQLDSINEYVLFYNSAQRSAVPEFAFRNVTVREFQYPNKLFNLSMRFLKIAAIDRLLGGVDVMLVPNFLFLNLSRRCKTVLIVHDLSFERYPEFFTAKKRLWHRLIGTRALCRRAAAIIAISENTKRDLVSLYRIDPHRISVVLPGISELFFSPIEPSTLEAVKKKYQLPGRYILALGNLEPRKNITTLIQAFQKMSNNDYRLVIAGGRGWKNTALYRQWQHSPVKDRIVFLGYVDAVDKPALYRQAAMFVYPSIYEGFGLPPIEAMACGTPVICSFGSSLPEAVGDAALMVDPYNIEELARMMDQLAADGALARTLVERGRKRSQQFRWQAAATAIFNIITATK